jgi:hypothetical protein
LDGEWTNPTNLTQGPTGLKTFGLQRSGNGTAGGNFNFYVNIMPGDVFGEKLYDYELERSYYRLDSQGTIADYRRWKDHRTDVAHPPLVPNPSKYDGDATGDGDVDLPDYELVLSSIGLDFRQWPTPPFPLPPPAAISADFDEDGDVDGRDFLTWQRGFGSGTTLAEGDSDGDGDVDAVDLTNWTNQYGTQSLASADMNSDETIDEHDLAALVVGYGKTSAATLADGDADGDGDVDLDDYLAWEIQYGQAIQGVDWFENALEFDFNDLSSGQIIVSTSEDEDDGNYSLGDLSLREALALVADSDADSIAFANIALGEIVLTQGALTINNDVTIAGPGADLLALSGNYQSQVFNVGSGVTADIRNLTIKRGAGGAIYNAGNLTLDGVAVEQSTSSAGGGITNYGTLLVRNSTISNNSASYIGGGILAVGPTKIVNSTISNNLTITSGGLGGGIFVSATGTEIVNSTISANRAASGSGIYSGGFTILNNTIVADNFSAAGVSSTNNLGGSFNVAASGYNLIGPGSGGLIHGTNGSIVLAVGQTSGLTALGNYGGRLQTHGLVATSPAIDAGSNTLVPADISNDQRGLTRTVDVGAVGPTGETIDIGAFEAGNENTFRVTILADENDGNLSAGDISLREALGLAQSMLGNNVITFAPSLTSGGPATITLSYDGPDAGTAADALVVDNNVTIAGAGANLLTVNGNSQTVVFHVGTGINATIRDLTVSGGSGGGINNSGNLTLERVAVENNSGGGILASAGALTVKSSTIANNSNTSVGGGLMITGGTHTITNSTISGNSSPSVGGGIFLFSGSLLVANSTITANRGSMGSGIYAVNPVILHNSIVANNLTTSGAATTSDISGSIGGVSSYNLIGVGALSNGVNGNIVLGTGVSAGLKSLGYYGGPLRTHALLSTSAAIDAGSNSVALAYGLTQDQRGKDRIADWDGLGGMRADIGAVELAFDEMYS